MTEFTIGLLGLGAMFILMIFRMPVGMAMLAIGSFDCFFMPFTE